MNSGVFLKFWFIIFAESFSKLSFKKMRLRAGGKSFHNLNVKSVYFMDPINILKENCGNYLFFMFYIINTTYSLKNLFFMNI